jgi:Tfp pilus assembly protein PilZ
VDYSTKDRSEKGFIHDISTGGVFIETRMPFRSEEDISLNFMLPEEPETRVAIHGRIARISPSGIGIEFKSLKEDQKKLIKSYIDKV